MISPLKSVTIENFRGVRSLTLELHPKVNVFFGANGAGKTTILDAIAIGLGPIVDKISIASRFRNHRFTNDDLRCPWVDDHRHNEHKDIPCGYTKVTLQTQSGVSWDVHKLHSDRNNAVRPSTIGLAELHRVIDPLIHEAVDTVDHITLEIRGEYDDIRTSPISLVAAYSSTRSATNTFHQNFYRDLTTTRLDGLRESLNKVNEFRGTIRWILNAQEFETRHFNQRNPLLVWVDNAIAKSKTRCSNLRSKVNDHTSDHERNYHDKIDYNTINPKNLVVDFEHDDGSKQQVSFSSLSDAHRIHFALIVDLARRMVQLNPSEDLNDPVRGTNTHSVVLIDEIDLHLDYPWQARVIQDLCEVFPNTQFIITTRSELVIGAVRKESVKKLVWEDNAIQALPVPFTQGATGERIQVELMGAPIIAPALKDEQETVDDKRKRYLKFVALGRGKSNEALALRAALEEEIPGDSALHRADLDMQRRSLMERLGGDEP